MFWNIFLKLLPVCWVFFPWVASFFRFKFFSEICAKKQSLTYAQSRLESYTRARSLLPPLIWTGQLVAFGGYMWIICHWELGSGHCGVFNQNKISFGGIGCFWLPWLAWIFKFNFQCLIQWDSRGSLNKKGGRYPEVLWAWFSKGVLRSPGKEVHL